MQTSYIKQISVCFLALSLLITSQSEAINNKNKPKTYVQKYTEQQHNLTVSVKTTKRKPLLKEYQPVQITVTNTGAEKFLLKAENIGLDLLSKNDLKRIGKKRFNVLPFTAIFSAQIFAAGQLFAHTLFAAKAAIAAPVIVLGTLFTSTLHQFRIKKINKREKAIFEELKYGIPVDPYSVRTVTVHVKKENMKPKFNLGLVSTQTMNTTRFNIDLGENVVIPKKKIRTDKK